jgi:hypothetical protein
VALAAHIPARAEGEKAPGPAFVRQLMPRNAFLFAEPGEMIFRGPDDPIRLYDVGHEV